jgi:cytoskeletal protein CcmA (bactofilin family)
MSTPPTYSRYEVQPRDSVNPVLRVAASRAAIVHDQSVLGKSLVVRGEITGSESLHILGEFKGSIELPGCYVHVGPNAGVSSNIAAREVVICGELQGNLTVEERVDVRKDASLTGDVVANRISLEEGAFFKGSIDMRLLEPNCEAKQAGDTVPNARPIPSTGAVPK